MCLGKKGIKIDSLKEFAEVSLFDGWISVSTLNYKGIRKYIIKDKIYKTKIGEMEDWARFETYQPLKEKKGNYWNSIFPH